LGGEIEARRAVEAVAVEQGHGGHLESGADGDQVLRQSGALEEAESGAGVEFDVQGFRSQVSVKLFELRITGGCLNGHFFSVPLCLRGEGFTENGELS